MLNALSGAACASLAVLSVACSNDGASSTGGDAIDSGAILSSIEDVRRMVEDSSSGVDPMLFEAVSYSQDENELQVTLAESQDGLGTESLEDLCGDLSEAISLPGLSVAVEKANGTQSTSCGQSE